MTTSLSNFQTSIHGSHPEHGRGYYLCRPSTVLGSTYQISICGANKIRRQENHERFSMVLIFSLALEKDGGKDDTFLSMIYTPIFLTYLFFNSSINETSYEMSSLLLTSTPSPLQSPFREKNDESSYVMRKSTPYPTRSPFDEEIDESFSEMSPLLTSKPSPIRSPCEEINLKRRWNEQQKKNTESTLPIESESDLDEDEIFLLQPKRKLKRTKTKHRDLGVKKSGPITKMVSGPLSIPPKSKKESSSGTEPKYPKLTSTYLRIELKMRELKTLNMVELEEAKLSTLQLLGLIQYEQQSRLEA